MYRKYRNTNTDLQNLKIKNQDTWLSKNIKDKAVLKTVLLIIELKQFNAFNEGAEYGKGDLARELRNLLDCPSVSETLSSGCDCNCNSGDI